MSAPDVRDFLRSVQVGLAFLQRFFGLLALSDVPGKVVTSFRTKSNSTS
jgi:hypothetical protein